MRSHAELNYVDRQSGQTKCDPIYAHKFLDRSYNTMSGRMLTHVLLSRRFVSQLYGWYHKHPLSRTKIKRFVERMNVNMDESLRQVDEFKSFNDFFTRHIDLSKRPIAVDQSVCIAPADGRVLAYPSVNPDDAFPIKGCRFNLRQFLRDDELTQQFAGGSLVLSRLYLSDYHHFHFPAAGVPSQAHSIPGRYYTVSSYSRFQHPPIYSQNYRMLTRFESDHFGTMILVEVGAFTVGSIRQRYRPDVAITKGQHKGYFEVGGSTVAVLFLKGAIQLDEDLCAHTREGLETYVRLGESIGRK